MLGNRYLRLIALLVVLLNVVNTTGEYLIARLLTIHVKELAMADATFNKQAYIGAFSGDYQFWVNVAAFLLQAFVTSRLVKYRGLRGVLLALPLIALGGYAIVAAGVGFSVVRWIKTAENATDYSIMNTARQLLWLPTSRDEKYKAKQAIDTFFVRGGDVLSAAAVYVGASVLHLTVQQFAIGNIALTLVWIGVALTDSQAAPRAAAGLSGCGSPARPSPPPRSSWRPPRRPARRRRGKPQLAARQAEKATQLHPYEPTTLEHRLEMVDATLFTTRPLYPFMGSTFDGGGFAVGPGYRARFGDTGAFDSHAAWSVRNYKSADATLQLPTLAHGRVSVELRGNWLERSRRGVLRRGNDSRLSDRNGFFYNATTVGVSTRVQATRLFDVGAGVDGIWATSGLGHRECRDRRPTRRISEPACSPRWTRATHPATREAAACIGWSGRTIARPTAAAYSFRRLDAEVQRFVPIMRENWVIAMRGLVSTTATDAGQERAVLPAAGPRRQPHAARLSRLALPRPRPHDSDRRVSLDRRTARRHGALPRRRQGRGPHEGPRLERLEDHLRPGHVVPHPEQHRHPHRTGAHRRGNQPGLLVQPELLEPACSKADGWCSEASAVGRPPSPRRPQPSGSLLPAFVALLSHDCESRNHYRRLR